MPTPPEDADSERSKRSDQPRRSGRSPRREGRPSTDGGERARGGRARREEDLRGPTRPGAARGADSWRAPGAGGDRPDGPKRPDRPFRPAPKSAPRRPRLPEERPMVPRDAWRDLRATAPPNALDEVVKAVGAGADAVAAGDDARAMELLLWAKSVAPRTATIREALGIAHYAAERYPDAHSELLAYRRLSGAQDQNHVLADCARAAGRHDKVAEYVDQMIAAKVDQERVAEGLMVLAGDHVDRGDLEGALETLRRADLDPVRVQGYHPRLWYLAGDISERLGHRGQAREYFEAIAAVDEEFGDVEERLAALD